MAAKGRMIAEGTARETPARSRTVSNPAVFADHVCTEARCPENTAREVAAPVTDRNAGHGERMR